MSAFAFLTTFGHGGDGATRSVDAGCRAGLE